MKAILVVAVSENLVIGKDNNLIWHLPKDLAFFKKTTLDGVVVMGRKNFESIPEKFRPLPKRTNVVVTRNKDYTANGCMVLHSLSDVYAEFRNEDRIYIIGGGQIYKQALDNDWIDEMLISHVHASFEGDTFFPKIDMEKWRSMPIENHEPDEKNEFGFTVKHYKRNK